MERPPAAGCKRVLLSIPPRKSSARPPFANMLGSGVGQGEERLPPLGQGGLGRWVTTGIGTGRAAFHRGAARPAALVHTRSARRQRRRSSDGEIHG